MFQLDLKSRKSIYEQVVDNLKELILTDVIAADEKLPSVRDLSKTLTVNPNTVQKSYRELERQGYVYSVSGLGTFASKASDRSLDQRLLAEIKERIKRDINELFYLGLTQDEINKITEKLIEERGTI